MWKEYCYFMSQPRIAQMCRLFNDGVNIFPFIASQRRMLSFLFQRETHPVFGRFQASVTRCELDLLSLGCYVT
jgi:hypothetical protein